MILTVRQANIIIPNNNKKQSHASRPYSHHLANLDTKEIPLALETELRQLPHKRHCQNMS